MIGEEIERLRRVAYGPGSSVEERAAAEEALHARTKAAVGVDAESGANPAETVATGERERSPSGNDEKESRSDTVAQSGPVQRHAPGIRPVWLIPIIIAALGVGAVGALSATNQLWGEPTASEFSASPTPQLEGGTRITHYPIGDVEAADRLFTENRIDAETFLDTDFLVANSIDPGNVRLLKQTRANSKTITMWAATSQESGLCLLTTVEPGDAAAASCASRGDFARGGGVGFGIDGFLISWDGREASVGQITH